MHFDPFDILGSFQQVSNAWMRNSSDFVERINTLSEDLASINSELAHQMKDPLRQTPEEEDFCTKMLAWSKKASHAARSYHQVFAQWFKTAIEDAPDLPDDIRSRSLFWAEQILRMWSPANYFWTNPQAVKRFFDSSGESLRHGLLNWLEDYARGDHLIRLTDERAFKIGENLAATPGQVVYRNRLFELIQYETATRKTWKIPIVMIQPWINKYYIFDLTPGNSFVYYLLSQGFTVFIVSWKNPTPDMRRIDFADYMLKGALKAIAVAARICGVDRVHAAGYCIGGTALAALMAWLGHDSAQCGPVADWTLFATLVDYERPGDLGMLITESSIQAIESMMEQSGCLQAMHLGLAFRLLNPDGLIWRYVVNNYLFGAAPPKSDMLFWNSDATRLPAALCSFYLREFYHKNLLSKKDRLVLGGRSIDLGRVRHPLYAVGAEQDHICPWEGTFQTGRFVSGPVRYVLAGDGHITGIVNPPSARSRKKFRAGVVDPTTVDPRAWLEIQPLQKGSWWPDWVQWLSERSGAMGPPPPMGSRLHPPLGPAPGTYVMER